MAHRFGRHQGGKGHRKLSGFTSCSKDQDCRVEKRTWGVGQLQTNGAMVGQRDTAAAARVPKAIDGNE
jgi:hypothetical protein